MITIGSGSRRKTLRNMCRRQSKAYDEVIANFSADGKMLPLKLIWENGKSYEIDRILRVDRCASLKAGGAGIRYVCRIRGQRVELYYEENGFWFVRRKTEGEIH